MGTEGLQQGIKEEYWVFKILWRMYRVGYWVGMLHKKGTGVYKGELVI